MARIPDLRFDLAGRRDQVTFDADQMLAAALKRARRPDFSDRSFEGPLRRLLTAYAAESDLSGFGRYAVRFDVMRSLRNLLHFDAMEERKPELLRRQIERPIFIMGLPRSGTTFLHELLIQDPTTAAPLSWQLVYPNWPRFGKLGAGLFKTLVRTQFGMMRLLAPELSDLHPVSADAPQECTDITAQVFQSLRFDTLCHIPTYQHWLEEHGHLDAYRFHRRFLQHLDAQAPGRRWILKSPDHVFALNEILAVYPDAHLVFVHRDPVSVLASVARLTEVLRRPFARRIDRNAIGRQVCASWVDGANRMVTAASRSDSILHLHYDRVVSAPIETANALFRHCGMTLRDDARARMRNWLDRARPRGSVRQRYSLASFGLNADVVRAQFAQYVATFRVRSDWDGGKDAQMARPA